ncbi:TonB-dependent receptor [Roseisolibacter sp. H3M3-2]|uniref:TonB-dependent receptor domain-containing protein n=1 Tax=Roseisolibacter sp. H3M3-2 TaxID=3031323 RepID=UPI0023DB1A2D|nr:TonB-dependent receptor [Roseisolibacter sp. H3M3-2]MDF1501946.1 TonB-dependent receptor [Roseisolibacter sp. H3M3-2]
MLEGRALERESARSLADVLNASVPGLWLWTQSPTSALARFGSVRGASSFGVTTPKVYIDGIEVANPLVLTQLDPSRVQRIEVIRGPQGAALYGADAISGVVQIVTRHEGVSADAPRAQLRASAGASASAFADRGVLSQDHALTLRAGTSARWASLGATLTTLGAFVPGAEARQLAAQGGARRVGARAIVSGTARVFAGDADAPLSPVLAPALGGLATQDPLAPAIAPDSATRQRVRQYTVGGSATLLGSERWTHTVVAGLDGYRLAGVPADGLLIPSSIDSALGAARGGADRLSLRAASTARAGDCPARAASPSLGVEHSTAREHSNGAGTRLVVRDPRGGGPSPMALALASGTSWWSSTGALAQGQASWRESLFLNGGARLERISGPASGAQVALLPMLGAAWVREVGGVTAKLRGAYGRGIRPARTVARGATWAGGRVERTVTALDPESQSGVEVGLDLQLGSRLGVQVTRFDQRASGLVQPVATVLDTVYGPRGAPRPPRFGYELQNVGAIDNDGWELQANAGAGALTVTGSLALVSSRVARLASGYRGDLRERDRVLEVPARTLGLTAQWGARRWSLAGSVTHADDWINYRRLAVAAAVRAAVDAPSSPGAPGGAPPRVPVGAELRRYWRAYDGVTRVGARAAVTVFGTSALTVVGENLLDRQTGEPDDVTVVPGRTVRVGLRTGF